MALSIRRILRCLQPVALVLGACSAHAERASPAICISADETDPRVLTVEYDGDAPVPCRTYYKKWRVREQIGAAQYTPGYCEALVDRVIENLAQQGFLCRRVGPDEDIEALYRQYQ